MLILQFGVPIPLALGAVVIINLGLAGIAVLIVFKGLCCCCGSKRESADSAPLGLRSAMTDMVSNAVRKIHGTLSAAPLPKLRDVEDAGLPQRDGIGYAAEPELPGASLTAGSPEATLLGRAQSIWQTVGRLAGFVDGSAGSGSRGAARPTPDAMSRLSTDSFKRSSEAVPAGYAI
mmetsp:Transcript_27718/g.71330  ORF Transcript_27718/g.71330 Transcript_27718/m.71330 type:complete len:176 (+) Transcript_27718:2-529(+)